MSYPEQIRKQIEEAEELEKRLRGEAPADTPAQEEGTPAEPAPEPVQDSEQAPAEPQPEPEAEPKPEPESQLQAEVDSLKAELEKERQRFRTLEGKYKAEPAQMREELAQLRAQIAELSKPKEEKKPDTPQPMSKAIGELAETYGESFVDTLRALAREEFSHLLPDAVKPLEEKVGGFERVQAQTAVERFTGSLDEAVPEWKTLNYDEGCISWLQNNKVPYSNITLLDALNDAAKQFNSATAIEIFNAYKEAAGLTNKQPEPEPPPKPLPKPDVAPPKSRTAAPPTTASPDKKIWTQAEIGELGRKYTSRSISREEYDRQMTEISKAIVEGRVR